VDAVLVRLVVHLCLAVAHGGCRECRGRRCESEHGALMGWRGWLRCARRASSADRRAGDPWWPRLRPASDVLAACACASERAMVDVAARQVQTAAPLQAAAAKRNIEMLI
jgi:hypothetical protein